MPIETNVGSWKNQWGDDIHTVVACKADGIPVYEVKNECTGRTKVLQRARLLLWLTDYGEPMRCNLMMTSNSLPGTVPGQQLEDSGEGMQPVPGDCLQYGLDLTHYMAVIENPEPMTSRLGQEVMYGHASAGSRSQDSAGGGGRIGPGGSGLLRRRHFN